MDNRIRHEGTVISISGNHVRVHILQTSACASCKAASQCTASESKVKIIDVWTDNSADFNVGDNVMVEIANRIGMMSVLVGFIAPICAVLFGVILTLVLTGEGCIFHIDEPYNQAVAAIAGLLMLLPYYIVLYLLRNKIRKKITFNILHLNS